MTLQIHSRLGPYEILAPLGAGGMGEVYRARDTRLDRTVAIKVLPAAVASQPDVRERFEREARAVAALNHPHICILYDVGRHDGIDFIVMEFLEGETLELRLARGPLPLNDALRFASEIADALDKAHRQGITHRDLKPGNVMITKSGTKLLDFGLAKLQTPSGFSSNSAMPTNQALTAQGTIIGTLQYMSPEQLEGGDADARTDVFAFGALVYEMVTGKRAFEGKSQVSLMAAILSNQPAPIASLLPMTPASLDALVSGCLTKSPEDRWQSMRDVHRQLEWIRGNADDGKPASKSAVVRSSRATQTVAAVVILLAGAGLSWLIMRRANPAAAPIYMGITAPAKVFGQYPEPAISPDGKQVAFAAPDASGKRFLWVRSFDSPNARPLPGAEDAANPFWSPDGRSLGFFADLKLKRVDLSGGSPQTLADAVNNRGGTWNADGTILFCPASAIGLMRVSMSGGKVDAVETPSAPDAQYLNPSFLPDGRHFLFTVLEQDGTAQIRVGSLDSHEMKVLPIDARSRAEYAAGYLFYGHDRNLMAQPFDAERLTASGEPVRLPAFGRPQAS